jgi:hypothetical protein
MDIEHFVFLSWFGQCQTAMSKTARGCAASRVMRPATASGDPAMAIKTLPGAEDGPMPNFCQ